MSSQLCGLSSMFQWWNYKENSITSFNCYFLLLMWQLKFFKVKYCWHFNCKIILFNITYLIYVACSKCIQSRWTKDEFINQLIIMKLWLNQKREHISTTLFFGHINCQKYSASFISHDTSILWRRRCKGSFQSQNEISMRSDIC